MDKIWIGYSLLGELSTAPWGCITYSNGTFKLDKAKWYNKLRIASNEGANICRVLPFSLFGNQTADSVFQPFKYVGNDKWDLTQYNDHYIPIMREAIAIAKSVGITIWLELFDHCGLWTGAGESVLHLNPWANNVQGYSNFYTPSEFVSQYVNRMLYEFGDTINYGLGNELTEYQMIVGILPFFKSKNIVPFSYGADLDLTGEENHNSIRKMQSMVVEQVWGENEKVQLFHCCHGASGPTSPRVVRPVYWWQYHSIAFSDDGVFPRPQGEQWAKTVEYVLSNQAIEVPQYGQGGKARLLFEVCPETENAHLIIRDMVAKCEEFGVTFENKGKYPHDYVDPVTPPEPPTPPKCGVNKWYEHLKTWNFRAAWLHLVGKH